MSRAVKYRDQYADGPGLVQLTDLNVKVINNTDLT